MIVNFERVYGERFAKLVSFVHSEENLLNGNRVVSIKSMNPEPVERGGTWYEIELEIAEWKNVGRGNSRIGPDYFLKVYEIIGREGEEWQVYPPV